jgi:hypothetical protein
MGGARGLLIATLVAASVLVRAQQNVEYTNNFKYNTGQSVQPIFEGWSRNADGTYNLHFGYLNRNYAEQPTIPIGPNNRIEPGGPDRGQPSFFYPRTHRNLFVVIAPRDWSRTAEVTWTVVHNGKTQRAVGWLQTEWEIDPAGGAAVGGNTHPDYVNNVRPTVTIAPVDVVRLPATLTLTTTARDDGLPKPRPRGKRPVGQETPPTLQGATSDAPVNVPQLAPREAPGGGPTTRPDGLTVAWVVWRGPAEVTFSPRYAQPKDAQTQTVATFTTPGEYVLRAAAYDGALNGLAEVKVTVRR